MPVNPLLRRLQVSPPESYEDSSYGGIIQKKRKKYHSGAQAFGVEGMGKIQPLTKFLAIILFGPIIFAALQALFGKKR